MRHADRAGHQGHRRLTVDNLADEGLVDLHDVGGQEAEPGQGGVARTEVVDRHPDPELAELDQRLETGLALGGARPVSSRWSSSASSGSGWRSTTSVRATPPCPGSASCPPTS